MDQQEVRRLLREGKTPRQVAYILGGSRTEVIRLAAKDKRQRSISKRVLIACFPALLLAGLYVAHHQFQEPDDREVSKRILAAADALPGVSSQDSWFMGKAPSEVELQISLIQKMTDRLNKALADNSEIPEVKEEATLFSGHLVPTIFTRGMTMWVGIGAKAPAMDRQNLEVVFYAHDDFTHPRISRRLFFYDSGWKALFIAALKISDETWYDAIVAHELWHAKRHREGAAGATAPVLSDPWVEEELEAHGIESKVLNARTNGAYRNELRAVVARRSASTIKRFLARVEPSDIKGLDGLFGNALSPEVDMRAAQYYLDLGLLWSEGRYVGGELQEQRKWLYRYLISSTSTNVQ